jgi:hypothetical protein
MALCLEFDLVTLSMTGFRTPALRGVPDAHTPSNWGLQTPTLPHAPSDWRQLEFPSPNGGCLATLYPLRNELGDRPDEWLEKRGRGIERLKVR